jgi:hypothetical protein
MSEIDITPALDDHARIAALEHLVGQQATAITAIETALGNSTQSGLSESDIRALEWIKAFIRLLTFGAV